MGAASERGRGIRPQSASGLSFPCWIILGEYNRVELDKAFDFDATKPIGSVSAAFLEKIAMVIKQASASRQVKGVNRS